MLLGLALVAGFAMTLVLTKDMTFYQDTWAFLINRREVSVENLFHPHNEHVVVFPVLIEMVLLRVFGMTSALPEYILLAVFLAVTAGLLYVYVQRRVGSWLALFATVLVLCVGPAFEVLLWPFEITFIGPLLFGIAMLLALERKDRLGDIAACAFLVLAIGFSGLGICFIAGAVVAVLQGPRQTWLARAYIFLIPLFLYAAWWVGWGHDAESHISVYNILSSPRFALESVAFALGSLLGLHPKFGSTAVPEPGWGRPLLVGLVAVLGYMQYRFRRAINPALWPVLAAAVANWLLTGFNAFPGRDPSASRYQYAGAIFLLMILANLFTGVRPGRKTLIAGAVVTALAVGPNLVYLNDGRQFLNPQSVLTRADTAAIEIAQDTVAPDFELTEEVAGTPSLVNVYAEPYLEAVEEYGSPAYTEAELEDAPELGRAQADIVLAHALGMSTSTDAGAYTGSGPGCKPLPTGEAAAGGVRLAPGVTRIELAPGPAGDFALRRFAQESFPVGTSGAPGDSVTELRIPTDRSDKPWHLQVTAEQAAYVCLA